MVDVQLYSTNATFLTSKIITHHTIGAPQSIFQTLSYHCPEICNSSFPVASFLTTELGPMLSLPRRLHSLFELSRNPNMLTLFDMSSPGVCLYMSPLILWRRHDSTGPRIPWLISFPKLSDWMFPLIFLTRPLSKGKIFSHAGARAKMSRRLLVIIFALIAIPFIDSWHVNFPPKTLFRPRWS